VEAEEGQVMWLAHRTFVLVDLQAKTLFDESLHRSHYAFSGPATADENAEVISVTHESKATTL
jgi:hypothetical protein